MLRKSPEFHQIPLNSLSMLFKISSASSQQAVLTHLTNCERQKIARPSPPSLFSALGSFSLISNAGEEEREKERERERKRETGQSSTRQNKLFCLYFFFLFLSQKRTKLHGVVRSKTRFVNKTGSKTHNSGQTQEIEEIR